MMKIERWRQIDDLLDAALECPLSDRAALLDRTCAGDADLRREVESLLAHQSPSENFIETSAFALAANLLGDDDHEDEQFKDQQIGAYRIIREVGRGGMGTVFLAERSDGEFQQQVALKVVRRSLADAELTRRFRRERQILASLNHPNIARLLDGGVSNDGEPFLAMEYVEGVRADDYCEEECLSTEERLKLFLAVCEGVSYAHQNMVLHLDIKPTNILVNKDGEPKLLDFGVAKLIRPEAESGAAETVTGLRAMTPDYASPEQVRGLQVTTATDVYSLGVLLYELLTGHRPYRLMSRSTEEIARAICEEDPEKPSTAACRPVMTSTGTKTQVTALPGAHSRARPRSPDRLRGALKGDLDWIVLMAMRKDPQRRYASVKEFSEDIRRHLRGFPVTAHKDTFEYRAKKFIRRNKLAVSASALILISVLGGLTISWRQFRNAQRERAKAEAVNGFLQSMLLSSDPGSNISGKPARETTVNDILDVTSRRLESGDLSAQPEVKAELQQIIGKSYYSQGRYDLAENHLRAALAAKTSLYGENSPETLEAHMAIAALLMWRADYAGAEPIFQQRLPNLRTEFLKGRIKGDVFITALSDYALLRRARGNSHEAELLLREAVSLEPRLAKETNSNFRQVETILALTLLDQGKLDEAEQYARKFVAEFRQMPNAETSEMGDALTMLGSVMMEKGYLAEAETDLRQAEILYRKLFDANALPIYDNLRLQAQVLYLQGRFTEAAEKIDQTLENYRRNSRPQYISYATALTVKGLILNKSGKPIEAEKALREAFELRQQNLPKGHFMSALTEGALGEVLLTQRRYVESEPLLLESYESLKTSQGAQSPRTNIALQRLVALYDSWGRPEAANGYRNKLPA